jgi:hypothetical protein
MIKHEVDSVALGRSHSTRCNWCGLTLESRCLFTKNVFYLGQQISPQLPGLSRDSRASVLLNGRLVWLFDDTEVTSKDDELPILMSNAAAYSHAPKGNIILLFGIFVSGN